MREGLTVAMIVRDERENLAELLPALSGAADDVVVVDTGSTDGSADFARLCGARAFAAPWNDDFAEARNVSLSKVRTSHILWLDADDRITAEDVRRVREAALARGRVGLMLLLINEDPDPNSVSSCWQLRVIPSDPRHCFVGRVHEQLQGSLAATGTPVEKLDVTVRHTGYLDPEAVLRKARRNLELLRREMREGRGNDVNVLYHFVRAALRTGELAEAADVARVCVESPPADCPVDVRQALAVLLARIERQRGQTDSAEAVLRAAVARVPDDPSARFFLGDLLRHRGDLQGARSELEAARHCPPRASTLPLPVAGLRRAVRIELGEIHEMLGDPGVATALYKEILAEQPEDRAARAALARALLGSGATDEAARTLGELTPEAGDRDRRLALEAAIAFERGQDDEAANLFQELARQQPLEWGAPLHLGHLALRRHDIPAAREHYRRSLGLADRAETRVALAAALLEGGEAVECLDNLARAVDLSRGRPLPPGTEALAGEALLRLGRPQEALEAFEKHLRRLGPDARVLSRVADCYGRLGAARAARLGYEEALRLAPGLQEAQQGLEALGARS
jgi:Flp pilus assembly protein TadD